MKHCPHGVSQRNGGWTLDPPTGRWVHGDPDCRLPSRATADDREETPPMPNEGIAHLIDPPVPQSILDEPDPIVVAVDPGDVHCGVAFFRRREDLEWGWECFHTEEFSPDAWTDLLAVLLTGGWVRQLVYERWRLYADKANLQTGSEFHTAQLIGVMRWMVRRQNDHAVLHRQVTDPRTLSCVLDGRCNSKEVPMPVGLIRQMADIKKPARGILNKRGIRSTAARMKTGGHCKDAEMHGWFWLLNGKARDIEIRPSLDLRHAEIGR